MLESIASSLLSKYLGQYVEGLEDSKNLKFSIGKGDVMLKNLRLKKTVLDEMDLPVQVSEGFLGQLTLKIPWSNLSKEAAEVRISDVLLLVRPKTKSSGTSKEAEDRAFSNLQSRLQVAELMGLDQPEKEKEGKCILLSLVFLFL